MRYLQIVFLLSIFLFMSCKKENSIIDNIPDNENENKAKQTDFIDLKVGDTWTYIGFNSKGYDSDKNYRDVNYNNDTLIIKVAEKIGSRYKINERVIVEEVGIPEYENISYWLEIDGNKIEITDISNSVFSQLFLTDYDKDLFNKHFTLADLDGPVLEFDRWFPINDYYEDTTGVILDYSVLNKSYDKLNYTQIVTPTHVDGPGHFWWYSKDHGIVRKYMRNPWTDKITGWDRIN